MWELSFEQRRFSVCFGDRAWIQEMRWCFARYCTLTLRSYDGSFGLIW